MRVIATSVGAPLRVAVRCIAIAWNHVLIKVACELVERLAYANALLHLLYTLVVVIIFWVQLDVSTKIETKSAYKCG